MPRRRPPVPKLEPQRITLPRASWNRLLAAARSRVKCNLEPVRRAVQRVQGPETPVEVVASPLLFPVLVSVALSAGLLREGRELGRAMDWN